MTLFKSLRQSIGNILLERKFKNHKRVKALCNFESSQLIGVIFKTDTQSDFEIVKRFLQFLSEQNNKVVALCYVDSKKVPDYYLLRKGFNFFARTDLNLYYIPKSQFINDFIEKQFDILIDLSTDSSFPITYVGQLSKAKYKIGRMKQNNNSFDMMIDTGKNNSVDYLIEHIRHYVPVLCAQDN